MDTSRKNSIKLGDERIEALKNGGVTLNGKRIKSVEEAEKVLNVLIRSVIVLAGGTPFIK